MKIDDDIHELRVTPSLAVWGVSFNGNGNIRSRKWYRVARLIYADGGWFELYWHADTDLRGPNLARVRERAQALGLALYPGVFFDKTGPRRGGEMEHV